MENPMLLTYRYTRGECEKGIRAHFSHRLRKTRIYRLFLGGALIVLGICHTTLFEGSSTAYAILLVLFGLYMISATEIRIRRSVAETFRYNPEARDISMVAGEDSLTITDQQSTGTQTWDSFVDFRICEGGILLYPMKHLPYWIPGSATVKQGNWKDFQKLVSERVVSKV